MKQYNPAITLARNGRGCYILDTVKGCSGCNVSRPLGCYDNCYAQNIASRFGFDFSKICKRDFIKDKQQLYFMGFDDVHHESEIIRAIKCIEMPFIRIGEMGDPSDNWEHTIKICDTISLAGKPIVIITKHWGKLNAKQLKYIEKLKLCINTSISALDNEQEIIHRLEQYEILKHHCMSVLRIVSCDFNTKNKEGAKRNKVQESLFKNEDIIDTVFRPYKNNKLVLNNVINVKKIRFLKSDVLASVYRPNPYLGYCGKCPDQCGIAP